MPRHNFLIQRHVSGNNDGSRLNEHGNENPNWRDCGNGDYDLPRDQYGNEGFQSRKKARAFLKDMAAANPQETYRLIQIVS